ncbi:hypothetical protein JHK87_005437 [Glycine soja]|nr:hypothetical protein JHK87_005437 [Glycine soja]
MGALMTMMETERSLLNGEIQPVIPPLSRARGDRCSVKPASRSIPCLGTRRPVSSLSSHSSTLNLERAGSMVQPPTQPG